MTERAVAIDGPAGSGKSSTARAVAERLGFGHLDTGSLYRAVTLAALDGGLPVDGGEESGERIVALAQSLPVRLVPVDDGFRPEIAGVDVSEAARAARVNSAVSAVAAMRKVRAWVTERLRAAAGGHPRGVVADGRDIGTVVLPKAALKVFLTASAEARARRRIIQDRPGEPPGDLSAEAEALRRRDVADSQRSVAPLRPAEDAIRIDTTDLTFEQQVDRIVALARNALP